MNTQTLARLWVHPDISILKGRVNKHKFSNQFLVWAMWCPQPQKSVKNKTTNAKFSNKHCPLHFHHLLALLESSWQMESLIETASTPNFVHRRSEFQKSLTPLQKAMDASRSKIQIQRFNINLQRTLYWILSLLICLHIQQNPDP